MESIWLSDVHQQTFRFMTHIRTSDVDFGCLPGEQSMVLTPLTAFRGTS
jgi:hypothetical protein